MGRGVVALLRCLLDRHRRLEGTKGGLVVDLALGDAPLLERAFHGQPVVLAGQQVVLDSFPGEQIFGLDQFQGLPAFAVFGKQELLFDLLLVLRGRYPKSKTPFLYS